MFLKNTKKREWRFFIENLQNARKSGFSKLKMTEDFTKKLNFSRYQEKNSVFADPELKLMVSNYFR